MESQVGSVLRKARSRREIELSDVEKATRIRVRFLRAIEDEEWDALPGGVYTRGFIRTYASFLGLDGDRLVEDFRREVEGPRSGSEPAPELAHVAASTATGSRGGRRSLPGLGWLAVPAVALIAAIAIVAPLGGGDEEEGAKQSQERAVGAAQGDGSRPQAAGAPAAAVGGVAVQLAALAEVWVCLLNADGEPLVDGEILQAGAEEGPFRSGSFTVSFGNGEVSMLINGKQAEVLATPSPVGYSIDSAGSMTELSETQRPTCT